MPDSRKACLSDSRLNCGFIRLYGRERTSQSAVMPWSFSSSINFSIACVEWPIVYTVSTMPQPAYIRSGVMTAATNFVAEPFRISARLVSRANNLIPGGAPYLRPVEASVDLVVLGLVIAWYSRAHRHSYNVEQGCRSAILILSIYWRDG